MSAQEFYAFVVFFFLIMDGDFKHILEQDLSRKFKHWGERIQNIYMV